MACLVIAVLLKVSAAMIAKVVKVKKEKGGNVVVVLQIRASLDAKVDGFCRNG